MSVIGLDVGNDTCLVAQAKRGGIDVLLNDESQRQNMTVASFSGKERFISDAASPHLMSNYKNSVVQLKRLIGRRFDDPMVTRDIAEFLTCKVVPVDDGAACGIEVKYQDKTQVLTPQAVMAMILGRMRDIANKNNPGATATDMVLSVPAGFNNAQRQAMLDASRIAGLNCLKLLNEGTAIALGYGFFRAAKKPFGDSETTNVLIVDVGHSHTTVTVVGYRAKSASILASVTDEEAGGREVDLVLAKHLAKTFSEANGGKDCWGNAKARIKLMGAAEKAKKTLSPHGVIEAHVNQEFLFEECDLRTTITIEQLEELVQPIAARIGAVVVKALGDSGLAAKDLECTEIVGAAVRVRAAKRAIADSLGMPLDEASSHGLGTSMNQDEAVAKGCALQCAMLSPLFRVKEFHIADRVPMSIRLDWEADSEAAATAAAAAASSSSSSSAEGSSEDAAAGDDDSGTAESSTSVVMFAVGDPTPVTRRITFHRRKQFTISASYTGEGLPDGMHTQIGSFTVGGFPASASATSSTDDDAAAAPAPKVRVDFAHDLHGILRIAHAVVLQEKKEEPAPAEAAPAAPAEPEAPAETDAKAAEGDAPAADTPAADDAPTPATPEGSSEDAATPAGDTPKDDAAPAEDAKPGAEAPAPVPVPAPADATADGKPKKKKFRKVPLSVGPAPTPGVMDESAVRAAFEAEVEMQKQDRVIQATQTCRNGIEEYVYAMRSKIEGELSGFAKEEEAETLRTQLADAEDWVCYGDGYDADLEALTARMTQLRALGDPIAQRAWEAEHRGPAAAGLIEGVEKYKDIVRSTDERYEHLGDEDRDRLRSATRTAEEWLRTLQDQQSARAPVEDAVLKTAEIQAKLRWLTTECDPVANKPKPPPPAPPAEADAAAAPAEADAAKPEETTAEAGEAAAEPAADAKPAEAEAKPADAPAADAPAADAPAADAPAADAPADAPAADASA